MTATIYVIIIISFIFILFYAIDTLEVYGSGKRKYRIHKDGDNYTLQVKNNFYWLDLGTNDSYGGVYEGKFKKATFKNKQTAEKALLLMIKNKDCIYES